MRKIWLVLRFLLLSVLAVATAAVFAATVAAFLPQSEYLIDQLSQLRLAFVLVLMCMTLSFFVLRSPWFCAASCLGIIVNVCSYPAFFLPAHHTGSGPRITMMSANIYGQRNYNYAALIDLVRERKPQILCVEETTPQWLLKLRKALPDYPFVIDQGYSGGSAIFSNIAIERLETKHGVNRFGVRGTFVFGNRKIILIVSHPPAPTSTARWTLRNNEFARLDDDVAASAMPVIIIGDFNSTPWSSYFQQLIRLGKLHDSEAGFGIQPSWSTLMPLPLVPIDHCVYTNEFVTTSRQVGPTIGSDHLPLFVELVQR